MAATDVFRPRLPLDPFSPASPAAEPQARVDLDAPWLAYDVPALTHAFAHTNAVILVLGAPNPHLLAPLLRSPTFERSLVLYVTHDPPPLTSLVSAIGRDAHAAGTHPAIRVLRLRAPLIPGAPPFALSLVTVLDAAAVVARDWRANLETGEEPAIAQFAQSPSGADSAFSVPEPLRDFPSGGNNEQQLNPRRTASTMRGAGATRPPSALATTAIANPNPKRASSSSLSLNSKFTARQKQSRRSSTADSIASSAKSKSTPNTRPFDALLSFLPPAQQEKAILKQVVLVSTLASGFLAGRGAPRPSQTHSTNSSIEGYNFYANSRPGSGASTPQSTHSRHSYGFAYASAWNSAPPSPSATHSRAAFTHGSVNGHGSGLVNGDTYENGYPESGETTPSRPGTPNSASVSASATAFISSTGTNGKKKRFSFFGTGTGRRVSASPAPSRSVSQPASQTPSLRGSVYGSDALSNSALAGVGGVSEFGAVGGAGGVGGGASPRAHIIHVLPASYRSPKLVAALSSFLASFAPAGAALSASFAAVGASAPFSSHGTNSEGGKRGGKAKAYVVAERALGSVLECAYERTRKRKRTQRRLRHDTGAREAAVDYKVEFDARTGGREWGAADAACGWACAISATEADIVVVERTRARSLVEWTRTLGVRTCTLGERTCTLGERTCKKAVDDAVEFRSWACEKAVAVEFRRARTLTPRCECAFAAGERNDTGAAGEAEKDVEEEECG
ncbi:hypothetical protein MSAN_00800300 [Mycena sanguinolenta]|uniref:Uncharacterized protein n=1 Tax=Mycena sanguinolenta TaxID=230812 RepID=A0A8H7DCS6_9AGAR|nr:hypothetical protein MSAN_00800300 [Mycena sanguinolenta]